MNKFYITTAIDYPNADPHIGHAYERIIADVFARWHRQKGDKTFFSYGLDEHGQKIQDVAEKHGISPQKFVDKQAEVFKKFTKLLNISNDAFVRTTDSKHEKLCKEMFQKVLDKGEIYKGEYKGNYCKYEETFYTDLQLVDGKCPECKRETKIVSEESYFFKMGLYQKRLIEHIEKNDKFILPETRRNEILSRLKKEDLRDLCVSRTSFDWGIKLPNDPKHIIYVWFDALLNYLSVINYPSEMWPADVHVIGKDIIWFHTVIWPTMLMALDIELPKTIYAHGFINDSKGEAMSKSLGNVVDPVEIVELYGADALRFYLTRVIPYGDDGSFSEKELVEKYNKELGNDLGNLLKRVQVLSRNYFENKVDNEEFKDEIKVIDSFNKIDELIKNLQYHKALDLIWSELRKINAYLNEKEPWNNENQRKQVIYNSLDNLRIIAHYLNSFIPESAEKISKQLKFKFDTFDNLKFGTQNYEIQHGDILFPKIEFEETPEFPLNLKVGEILEVKRVPDADKLYLLQVNLGTKNIQLVAGVAPYYSEEELKGRHIIVVTNLKKAKLRGFESQGMLLAGSKDDKVKLLSAPNTSPGGEVNVEGFLNATREISYDEFQKVKLKVKDKHVWFNDKILKTSKEDVEVDVADGASVR